MVNDSSFVKYLLFKTLIIYLYKEGYVVVSVTLFHDTKLPFSLFLLETDINLCPLIFQQSSFLCVKLASQTDNIGRYFNTLCNNQLLQRRYNKSFKYIEMSSKVSRQLTECGDIQTVIRIIFKYSPQLLFITHFGLFALPSVTLIYQHNFSQAITSYLICSILTDIDWFVLDHYWLTPRVHMVWTWLYSWQGRVQLSQV